jgi:hypothetical protein
MRDVCDFPAVFHHNNLGKMDSYHSAGRDRRPVANRPCCSGQSRLIRLTNVGLAILFWDLMQIVGMSLNRNNSRLLIAPWRNLMDRFLVSGVFFRVFGRLRYSQLLCFARISILIGDVFIV